MASVDMDDLIIVGANGLRGYISIRRSYTLVDLRNAIIMDWDEDHFFSNFLFKVEDAVIDSQHESNVSAWDLIGKDVELISCDNDNHTSVSCKEIMIEDDEETTFI